MGVCVLLRGAVIVKNVSGTAYEIDEMPGVTIPDGEQLDLMLDELASNYGTFAETKNLVENETAKQLNQDIVAGKIEVLGMIEPRHTFEPEDFPGT